MIPSVQPGSTVTTIQGAYLSDEVGAEASVQRRMRYQPGPLVPRANSRYRFSLEIRQMLDVGYILSGFGAGAGALEFMIIRTIGPLLLPNSTRRPVMNAQRTKAAKARGVRLGTPANLSNQLGGRAKGNAAMAARADKRAADLLPLILPMKAGGASLRQIGRRAKPLRRPGPARRGMERGGRQ